MADMNANKVDDMLNALNSAMEIHAQNAVKNLPFNKTELVEIVDITKRDQGWYVVWNGSTRYMAFSENTSYKMGAKVYVNIPNNNFDNQKIIVGQQVGENEQSIFFRSPLERYQPVTDNVLTLSENPIQNEYELVANWSGVDLIQGQQVIEIFKTVDLKKNESFSGHKYMAISANVRTLLGRTTIAGGYGIRVVLQGAKKQDVTADAIMETRSFYLDTNNMIGSVYNFDPYYKQEALFNISDFDELYGILVAVYQDGAFWNNENLLVPHTYEMGGIEQVCNPNIFIKDLEITFGKDADDGRDTLEVKTLNGKTYSPLQKDSLNQKNFYIEWMHLNPEKEEQQKVDSTSKALAMSDISNYVIHWYQDSLQSINDPVYIIDEVTKEANNDMALQAYKEWLELENNTSDDQEIIDQRNEARNKVIATFNLTPGLDYDAETFAITAGGQNKIDNAVSSTSSKSTSTADNLAGPFWREIAVGDSAWEYRNFLPDVTRQYVKIKVIIEYWNDSSKTEPDPNNLGYVRVESPEFQLTNSIELPVEDKNSRLRIEFLDETDGNYPIYNSTTGQLLSRLEETRDRTLEAVFDDSRGISYFNGSEAIIWKIPISNSMILLDETFYNKNEKLTKEDFDSFETDKNRYTQALLAYEEATATYEASDKGDAATQTCNAAKETFNAAKKEWRWGQLADTIHSKIEFEPGYVYIKRESFNINVPVTTRQKYRIMPYYNKGRTTNTVWCYVIKNNEVYQTAVTMTFNQHGTCGTDYTFTLGLGPKIIDETPPKEQGQTDDPPQVWTVVGPSDTALTVGDIYTNSENNEVPAYHEILFDLYNSKNERIDLTPEQKNVIINAWIESGQRDKGYYAGKNNASNLEFIKGRDDNDGRVIVRAPSQKKVRDNITNLSIEDFEYIVLQAFVTSEVQDDNNNPTDDLGSIEFYQYYPLHIREAGSDWELNGSDYIVYDDKGANPTCYNDKFELVSKTPNVEKITGGFKIIYNDIPGPRDPSPETYYPHIDKTGKLQPTPLFIGSISKDVALVGLQGTGDNLRIVYTCPIVIIENKYEIPAINKWNGEMVLDKDGNKILASMVGAGHKNPEGNTFSGVLMGDVEYKDERTGEVKPATGLFGYDNSEQTFGFNTNGEAFIGKSDVGRIYVDGNTGRITSAARESYDINKAKGVEDNDPRGTEINLKENYIDIQGESSSLNEDTNKSRIHLDTKIRSEDEGGTEAYFSIHSKNGNRLIHIADDNYYLQTEDYTGPTGTKGLRIDLKNGTFDSKGKLTITGDNNSSINFGKTFKVDGNGKVILGNLKFVDSNGNVLTSRNTEDTADLTADNIKPQWKTFVTDISGYVTMQKVKVSCTVPVYDYYYKNTIHYYQTTQTGTWTYDYHSTMQSPRSASDDYGNSLTETVGPATGFTPGGEGESSTIQLYPHYATVTYKYAANNYVEGEPVLSYWKEEQRTATGQTNVPVITSLNFSISKVSMWTLTNDSSHSTSHSINAKSSSVNPEDYVGTEEKYYMS